MTFCTDDFKRHVARLQDRTARRIAAIGDITDGAIVRQDSGERWDFLLPDMTEPGKWRMQYFDVRGFSGHGIYNTIEQLAIAAVAGGFLTRDDDALDRVQELASFQRGNYAADLIRQVNAGELQYADANALLSQFDANQVEIHAQAA